MKVFCIQSHASCFASLLTDFFVWLRSWGTYWGEHGWFKIVRDQPGDLGIQLNCDWAVPVHPDPPRLPEAQSAPSTSIA